MTPLRNARLTWHAFLSGANVRALIHEARTLALMTDPNETIRGARANSFKRPLTLIGRKPKL